MHRQLIAVFSRRPQLAHIAHIQARIDTLADHVHAKRNDIHIAGPLTVAKQRAFNSVSSCHHTKLSRRNASASIIMRMQGQHNTIALREIAMHPFDLIGINIRR